MALNCYLVWNCSTTGYIKVTEHHIAHWNTKGVTIHIKDGALSNLDGPAIVDTTRNLIKFFIRGDETSPEVWGKL